MSFFIAQAAAPAAGQQSPGIVGWLLPIGLLVFMYFMVIRPQRTRQKKHEELMGELTKGQEVVTSSGMLGKITDVDDAYITLKVAENTELKFQKAAVHAVLPKGTIKSL